MANDSSTEPAFRELRAPEPGALLEAVTELARAFLVARAESELVERFLATTAELFPGRLLLLRVVDLRSAEPVRVYGDLDHARRSVASERLSLKESSIDKTGLKTAVVESARLRLRDRWDSPFEGVAAGFVVPLVAAGELHGVLDVGYPLGVDRGNEDEPLMLPLVNQLSVALQSERLSRDTSALRDYQNKVIEHANALIIGIDRNWRVMVCNPALCRLIGYRPSELVGKDFRDHFPAGERSQLAALVRDALAGGEGLAPVELELVDRAGESVRTVWSVAAIRRRLQVSSVVAVGQDQTRLQELQSQVIQAEKLATLGQLAAGVVHELNNPLTSISVYAEYLLKKGERRAGAGDREAREDLEKLRRIGAGAQRILAFSRDLVQYAKPASERAVTISPSGVVRQSLSFCEHLFDRHRVELVQELGTDLPGVAAVPGQLEQVVVNLVTNAVHACEPGGVVTVRTALEDGCVVISVADSGPGIAAELRDRIFEPFFTTKTDGQGTGLGLSIVKNIIEQHGGSVVLESSSRGALFRCRVPVIG